MFLSGLDRFSFYELGQQDRPGLYKKQMCGFILDFGRTVHYVFNTEQF